MTTKTTTMMTRINTITLFLSALLLLIALVNGETLANGEDVDAYVKQKIAGADVMVFAKSYCPYCKRTRQLLQEVTPSTLTLEIIDLDLMEDGHLIQMELMTETGQRTVPNVFIKGKHIGGNSDVMELNESGELETLLSGMVEKEM